MKEDIVCDGMQSRTSPVGVVIQHLAVVAINKSPGWMVATITTSDSMLIIYFLIFKVKIPPSE